MAQCASAGASPDDSAALAQAAAGGWRWGQALLRPYAALVGALVACQAGQAAAALLLPALSAAVIDRGVLAGDEAYIRSAGLAMAATTAVQMLLSILAVWFAARVALGVGRDLRGLVFRRVQLFSLQEMRDFGAPSLITRTTNDVQQLQDVLLMVLTLVVSAPIMGVGGVIMALHQDAQLALVLLVSVPLLAAAVSVLMARTVPLFGAVQAQIDRVNRVLREQITGMRVIRAFVRDRSEAERFGHANDDLSALSLRVGRLMALNMPLAMGMMHLTGVALVWAGSHRLAAGSLEVGSLVAFLAYVAQILMSVMMAALVFAIVPRAVVSAGRILQVLRTAPSVADPAGPDLPFSDHGELVFEDVGFHYPGAEQPIVSNVTFRVGPGQTVGVIGATGSGKSTLLHLAARLFDATQGCVRVDGQDVRQVRLDALWSQLGLVPQEPFLFSGSIADNLRYGCPGASDAQVWHALEVAQAADFVRALPDQLQAPVAQGGTNFSGGQRQRLTIARALVRRPRVYLFDDCFSALDYGTEARLRAALARELDPRAAVLIVGQRVHSLRQADCILVLEHGRIVGAGRHEQLVDSCAAYREIVRSQHADEALP